VVSRVIHADIAVVGAGPAGTATAVHLGQLGVRNVVLVDRHDFPRDKTCGSGVSPKGIETLAALGVWRSIEPLSYRISGLRMVTNKGREVFLSGGEDVAAVVCLRRVLDAVLLDRARAFGVRFVPNVDVRSLTDSEGRTSGFLAKDGLEVRAKYTVVADGAHSRLVVTRRPKTLIQAIMGWWEDVPFRPHHVEMIFDPMVRPYYGWLFPEGESRVNIGICYPDHSQTVQEKKNARTLFASFIDKHYAERLRGSRQVGELRGHPISFSYRVGELTSPGRIVVGEAGRMTHPATAEGIYQGMRSGMLAAEALADIVHRRTSEDEAFARYESRCRGAFQPSFFAAKIVQRALFSPIPDWIAAAGQNAFVRRATARFMARM
jgi:geranylgeranyl reductase family protein